jgi:hypothetical protein
MPAAIIPAVAAVAGAVISSKASSNAARAQQNAANTASQTQLQMYNQTRQDQTPWRVAGGNAVGALSNWYGLGANGQVDPTAGAKDSQLLQSMPGYQFQLQQGNQAVQRNLAAQGLLGSGAAGKALTQYGQGFASNYANQYTNGLQSLAGLGQTSAAQTGAMGANAANQIGSNQIYAGNAQASGYANQANAVNQGLSGLTGALGQYQIQQGYQNYAQNAALNNSYQATPYSGGGGGFMQDGYIVNP